VEDLLGRAHPVWALELDSPVEDLLIRAGINYGKPAWNSFNQLWKTCLEELDSPVEYLFGRAGLTCERHAWKSLTPL
jgi:hypothetical protein